MQNRLHVGILLSAFGARLKITLLAKTIAEPAASITLKLIREINDTRFSAFGLVKGQGFAQLDGVAE